MRNYYIILINFIFGSSFVFSQNYVDILKINASTTPFNTFDSSSVKTKINEFSGDLTLPVKVNDRLSVITGIIYEDIQTKIFADGAIKEFGSTALKLGFNKQLNDKWSATGIVLPKIASDYSSIGNKDFQIGTIAVFKYKKRDNLNYKVGLYYNSELFGPFFVPMLGMYYQSSNKKIEANIMLPLQADVNYKLNTFMNVGCNFNGQIRSYHLNDMTFQNKSTYVTKSTNELYAYLKFNFTNSISLQTKVGQSLGRSYRVYDENDQVTFGLPLKFVGPKRQQLNSDFSDGMIYQVTLLYRLNL